MALDPTYQSKASAEAAKVLDATTLAKVAIGVRAAKPGYPVDQTHCTIGGTRYEIDHVDGDGKPRTPDDVAAILKQLMYDGGHAVDPTKAEAVVEEKLP